MKKLVILPNINGKYGQLNGGQFYPYSEVYGTESTWFDIYMIDTTEMLNEGCWFVNGRGEVNLLSQDTPHSDFHTGKPNEVIIASTDIRTKLPTIPQFVLDKFLDNTKLDWLVDYGTTETGDYVTLCSSDSLVSEVNCQICEDYPIQDNIWASRRWNLDHTDYCDLSGFENEWEGVSTTLDLDTFDDEDLETIQVNGKTLVKLINSLDNWGTNNKTSEFGDLWFQPSSSSKFYPDVRGRLLEYCKAEDLEPNPGFDDWAEVQIHSINGFYN